MSLRVLSSKTPVQAAAKPKISKLSGNEFIKFKVPAKLNTTKNIDATVLKISNKIDEESKAYVGVPVSGLIIKESGNFELSRGFQFKSSDGKVCSVYATDTESASGFSLVIAKLTKESIKKLGAALKIVKPVAYVPKK